jgi:hypothetical protein
MSRTQRLAFEPLTRTPAPSLSPGSIKITPHLDECSCPRGAAVRTTRFPESSGRRCSKTLQTLSEAMEPARALVTFGDQFGLTLYDKEQGTSADSKPVRSKAVNRYWTAALSSNIRSH